MGKEDTTRYFCCLQQINICLIEHQESNLQSQSKQISETLEKMAYIGHHEFSVLSEFKHVTSANRQKYVSVVYINKLFRGCRVSTPHLALVYIRKSQNTICG